MQQTCNRKVELYVYLNMLIQTQSCRVVKKREIFEQGYNFNKGII